jgi:hypothetical protein
MSSKMYLSFSKTNQAERKRTQCALLLMSLDLINMVPTRKRQQPKVKIVTLLLMELPPQTERQE